MTTSPTSALIADIGATNARFALLVDTDIAMSETYAVADYASPIEAARAFLAGPAAGHAPNRALIAAGRACRAWSYRFDKCRMDRRFGPHLQRSEYG